MKVISTEIIDHEIRDEHDIYRPSGVSVLVEVQVNGRVFFLDYQTTTTFDYGAIFSRLAPYDNGDYDNLRGIVNDDAKFFELIDNIKKDSRAQELWEAYIAENYNKNDDHFGGMDANSEFDEMTKKTTS